MRDCPCTHFHHSDISDYWQSKAPWESSLFNCLQENFHPVLQISALTPFLAFQYQSRFLFFAVLVDENDLFSSFPRLRLARFGRSTIKVFKTFISGLNKSCQKISHALDRPQFFQDVFKAVKRFRFHHWRRVICRNFVSFIFEVFPIIEQGLKPLSVHSELLLDRV